MKRIVMLATLLAFVLGMAATASAADLVASGSWKIGAVFMDNYDFIDSDVANVDDSQSEDDLALQIRARTAFDFIASENLMGKLQLEIGTSQWGSGGANPTDLGADGIAIEVKSAYVKFVWPNTDVTITSGIMPIALPGGPGGNPILDNDMTGIVIEAPLMDSITLLTGYTRLDDENATTAPANDEAATTNSFLDAAFVALPMDFDGVGLTPYMAFVWSGSDYLADLDAGLGTLQNLEDTFGGLTTQNMTIQDADATGINITYAGLAFDVSLLDPLTIEGAFHYGASHGPWDSNTDRSGWLGELQLTYTGLDFVTPALYFAYSSGEDGNGTDDDGSSDTGGESERLPTVSESYSVGSFWFGNDWLDNDIIDTGSQEMGFWTLGLFLSDISFVEGLTHEINIMYVEGTNDKNVGSANNNAADLGCDYGQCLTEKDSLWEFDLNTKYQIYDELSAVVRLGYIDMSLDDEVWAEIAGDDDTDEDAAKLTIGVEYAF